MMNPLDRTSRFRAVLFWGVFSCAGFSACASGPEPVHSYKLYPGQTRPVSELAVVQMGDAGAAEFNGRPVYRQDWSDVHLLPGKHEIRWQTEFGVSVMIEPSGFATHGRRFTVELDAGEVYSLRSGRTTGPGYRVFFWIEEASTGAVIAGTRKP